VGARPARAPRQQSRPTQILLHPATRAGVFILCLLPFAHLTLDWLSELGYLPAWNSTLGPEQIHETQVRTGLWTLRLLAVTLAVTPARQLFGLSALAKYRRTFGLFVFFYVAIHVATWTWADAGFDVGYMLGEIRKHRYILVGMLGFLLLVPLAITSTKGWIRRLGGARWNRLHRLIYPAAVAGTVHYLWAVKKDTLFPLVYLTVFALLLGYRAARALQARAASAS
jgi:sulfoxide reductase heme-binding subunit YedZ